VAAPPKLLAISDLHVAYAENRAIVADIRPDTDQDWLIVAGDVGDLFGDVEWALTLLSQRFARVIWAPGNHELWTTPSDPVQLRGVARYSELVSMCRRLGVVTPEDPYPVWEPVDGEPLRIIPLFVLYDYTYRPAGTATKAEALQRAYDAGVVGTDEHLLHPDPYATRDAWCSARIEYTRDRLDQLDDMRTVLVNHFPLNREATRILRYPEFALWCGSVHTEDWHVRYRAAAVVYGHLHIPRTLRTDGVPFLEVSLGYPREWQRRTGREPGTLTPIFSGNGWSPRSDHQVA
jgi:3',5'-cyclic AMP phosphodiesterase CpdA